MKRMIAAAFAAALAMGAAAPASAGEWTGCSVGVQGALGMANTDVSAGGGGFSIEGLGSDGTSVGVYGDCTISLGKVALGAFVDWNTGGPEFNINPGLLSAKIDNTINIGAKLGYELHPGFLPYILAAYTMSDLEIAAGGTSLTLDLTGITLGAGVDMKLTQNLILSGEFRHTEYDKENIGGFLDLETTKQEAMLRLKYCFGCGQDDRIAHSPMK